LCREFGAGLCYSEMISCYGLTFGQDKTLEMTRTNPAERPVALQLFGSEPEVMGAAAAKLSELPIDLIDINMGCPVKKVLKKGAGAALLRNPNLAARIIKQVRANSTVPVTVKIRTGWNHESIVAPGFAKMAEDQGAAAVILHARTWTDGFSGEVDLRVLADTKRAVSIPVIGNGGVQSYEQGLQMMDQTGCDAVMIGRAALGSPWVFQPDRDDPSLRFRLQALARHLELIEHHFGQNACLAKIKNHVAKYFKGVIGGAAIRQRIFSFQNFVDLQDYIACLLNERQAKSSF
jgi:tRNA-dihydrouridine synthase B